MMKILIIEKEKKTAENTAANLKKEIDDISVHICLSGKDGLKTLKRKSFDLVIFVSPLADMTGFELLEGMAEIGGRWPVIILGNSGEKGDGPEFIRQGAYDYIIKDGSFPNSLVRAAQRALNLSEIFNEKSKLVEENIKFLKLKELSRIAHVLNHEVNNPLMAIIGNTQLLLNRNDIAPDELRAKLLLIEESARRIARVMIYFADSNYDQGHRGIDDGQISEKKILVSVNSKNR